MQISTTNTLSNTRWLMFLDSATSMSEFFADIFIPFDCELLVAQWEDGGVEMSITEVYHVHPTRPLQLYRVAKWTCGSGLTWSAVPLYHRRRNLQAIVLKGAYITDVGYKMLTEFNT
jgi:hypothetical protein